MILTVLKSSGFPAFQAPSTTPAYAGLEPNVIEDCHIDLISPPAPASLATDLAR
jgi:hypothetical protein